MYSRREVGDRYGRIPKNYSGSVFREEAPPAIPSAPIELAPSPEELPLPKEEVRKEASVPVLGRLFGEGGIGSEELLLLGLILLLSQSEERDDLLLLILLLLVIR